MTITWQFIMPSKITKINIILLVIESAIKSEKCLTCDLPVQDICLHYSRYFIIIIVIRKLYIQRLIVLNYWQIFDIRSSY